MVLETKCLSFGLEPPLFPHSLSYISMFSQLWNAPECHYYSFLWPFGGLSSMLTLGRNNGRSAMCMSLGGSK